MKKTITIQLAAFLFLFGTVFTSCDMMQNISNPPVHIRFENTSASDLENVSAFGVMVESLKAGEQSEYIEVASVYVDEDGNPIFHAYAKIGDDHFNDTPKRKCELCAAGYLEDLETLKRGEYTLSIDLSEVYDPESDNETLYLVTTFEED